MSRAWGQRYTVRFICLLVLLAVGAFATSAGAADTVTYTATQTIPVPPASNYAGSAGGDGWAVALTPTAVYNVFHHNSQLQVACHLQSDASACWAAPKTITDASGGDFEVPGQPGLWLDQVSGHLYVFVTRASDSTGGVACIDTKAPAETENPFCGFTELTGAGESPDGISEPAAVGSRWFAFNYANGDDNTGARNKLLCFDLSSFSACAGQPFAVDFPSGAVSVGTFPTPSVAAFANEVIVPIQVAGSEKLACFDGAALGTCGGNWPVTLDVSYVSSAGTAMPLLTATGKVTGLCLPVDTVPCYSLAGASVDTPAGLEATITPPTETWNGPAFVLGPRIYLADGGSDEVHCYDYNLAKSCANFPKSFDSLNYIYTTNADPQRPTCIWVNADGGAKQIQNFDAFTGGACGEGPIRVLASSFVVDTPLCAPGSWKSLQVTSPARDTYASGSVAFQDASGTAIQGAGDVPLDGTGTANLSGLDLSSGVGLPQFLITLNGTQGKPGEVVVQLTWTGVFDPSCTTKPGTTVVNPPAETPPPVVNPPAETPPPPTAPGATSATAAKADVRVTLTPPTYGRVGAPLTFRWAVKNNGPDTATGVVLHLPVPADATVDSATTDIGNGCDRGKVVTCYIGTLASGATANITVVLRMGTAGTLTLQALVDGDHDPDASNNSASAATRVIGPSDVPPAPPRPTQPGTYNAVGIGTINVNGVDRPADQPIVLGAGDTIDVSDGAIVLTAADGSTGVFSGTRPPGGHSDVPARFTIALVDGVTELTLVGGDFSVCTASRSVAATSQQPVRRLWGSATGNFRTKARYSSAAVRGTVWLVEDRCNGTFTSVVESNVEVVDFSLNKTLSLGPGQSYLAQPPKGTFKPPAATPRQTPAQVRKRGLIWGGRTYTTRAAFEKYLQRNGNTWSDFAKLYPRLAAALASRK